MATEPEQFDDPEMKSLLQKAWGQERAPDALRARIVAELAQTAQPSVRRSSPSWLKYAVAALVALGISYGYLMWQDHQSLNQPTVVTYKLPSELKLGMARLHQSNPGTLDQSVVAGLTDLAKIGERLTASLGKPVLSVELPGWKFVTAGVAKIGDQPVARLVYTDGAHTASVFSIVAPTNYGLDGATYEELHESIALAGVVRNGMIYCVLTSPAGQEQIKTAAALRDSIVKCGM